MTDGKNNCTKSFHHNPNIKADQRTTHQNLDQRQSIDWNRC